MPLANSEAPESNLARFNDQWAKTPVGPEDMYSDIPDGTYDAVIEDAHLTETVSTGRPMVIWKLRIQGPQAVNRLVTKNRVITENTLGIPPRRIWTSAGCRCHDLSELPARLGRTGGPPHRPRKAHEGWEGATSTSAGEPTGPPRPVCSDDIPF
jgi:hypothetical protein